MGIMSWDLEYPAKQLRAALHGQDRRASNEEPLEQSPHCVPNVSQKAAKGGGDTVRKRRSRGKKPRK